MNKIYEPFLRLFIDIFIHYVHTNNRLSILAGNIFYKTERKSQTENIFSEYFVSYYTANSDPILQVEADQRSNASVSARLVIDQSSLR